MKKLKKYRVRYSFDGGGYITVESTNKESARLAAKDAMKEIIPLLRPHKITCYTDVKNLPDEAVLKITRNTGGSYNWDLQEEPQEPLDGTTPTQIY